MKLFSTLPSGEEALQAMKDAVEEFASISYNDRLGALPIRKDAKLYFDFTLATEHTLSPYRLHSGWLGKSGTISFKFVGPRARVLTLRWPCEGVIEVHKALGDVGHVVISDSQAEMISYIYYPPASEEMSSELNSLWTWLQRGDIQVLEKLANRRIKINKFYTPPHEYKRFAAHLSRIRAAEKARKKAQERDRKK